jgi:hypothetical protein
VQQCLPLLASAIKSTPWTVFLELGNMSPHGAPAFDLTFVVDAAPAHVVAAIPLKPTARIFLVK